jgi:perosamine synthetase
VNIFNSLGSNYSRSFVYKSLFGRATNKSISELKQKLHDHYSGTVTLTYKGRMALELALRESGLPAGSQIGINGFTCYVVYDAVIKAGYMPVFIDVASDSLNFGINELQAAGNNLKAIIIQNTLGLPIQIGPIEDYCKQRDILIIEDLAHSLGAVYEDGREAGTVGMLIMTSFSQDKPLDAVAGGAMIDRRSKLHGQSLAVMPKAQRLINRTYPFWSSAIRNSYPTGTGRFLHSGLKKLRLLATPMGRQYSKIYAMPAKAATLINGLWHDRDKEFAHRRMIAGIYANRLPESIQFKISGKSKPLYLRYPIRVEKRAELIDYLKQRGIHIGDTWYDAPVGPKRYMRLTNYKRGMCPNADRLAETIVNLPTHININEAEATALAIWINTWSK